MSEIAATLVSESKISATLITEEQPDADMVRLVRGTVENLKLTFADVDSGAVIDLDTATAIDVGFYPASGSGEDTAELTKEKADMTIAAPATGIAQLELSAADTTLLGAGTRIVLVDATIGGKKRRALRAHVAVE